MKLTRNITRKKPSQVYLIPSPNGRDWFTWQTCSPSELPALVAEAAAAGFDAVRMVVSNQPLRYRVGFQRKPSTP